MKKLLMGIGSITAFVAPIVTVISCGKIQTQTQEPKKKSPSNTGSDNGLDQPSLDNGPDTSGSGNGSGASQADKSVVAGSNTVNPGNVVEDKGDNTNDQGDVEQGSVDDLDNVVENQGTNTNNPDDVEQGADVVGTEEQSNGAGDLGVREDIDVVEEDSDDEYSDEDQQEPEDDTEDPEDEDENAFLLKVNSLYGQEINNSFFDEFEVRNDVSRIGKKPDIKDIEKLFDLSKKGRVELNDSLGSYEFQMEENDQVEYKITDYLDNGDEKTAKFIFKPVETDVTIDNSKNWYGQAVQKSDSRDDLYYIEHLEATTWKEPSKEDIKNLFNIVGEVQEITNSSKLSYLEQLKDESSVNYDIVVKAPFDKPQTFTLQIICPELSIALKDGQTLYGREVLSWTTYWYVYNNPNRQTGGQEPDTEVIKSMFDFVGEGKVELYGSYGTYKQQMDEWGYATYRISSSGPLQDTVEEWFRVYEAK